MKTKFFAVLFVTVFSAGYMQAQFSFGARAGLNMSNMAGKDIKNNKMKPGFQIGVVGNYAFSDAFSIQPAILYATQGYKYDGKEIIEGSMIKAKSIMHLNYIQIPVHAQYKIDMGDMRLLLQAGPYFGYGLGGKLKMEATIDGEKVDYEPSEEKIEMGSSDDKPYRAFDSGLGGAVGLQFGNFQACLGYQYGLVDLFNPNWLKARSKAVQEAATKVTNTCLSFSLTYLF